MESDVTERVLLVDCGCEGDGYVVCRKVLTSLGHLARSGPVMTLARTPANYVKGFNDPSTT